MTELFDQWSDDRLIRFGRKVYAMFGSTSEASLQVASEMYRRGLLTAQAEPAAPPKVTVVLLPREVKR